MRKSIIHFIALSLAGLFIVNINTHYSTANAAESTATLKGFSIDGLTYINDQLYDNIVMETDKYRYGEFSMWSGCYKNITTDTDGSKTWYYFVLVESSIDSQGHKDVNGNVVNNRWFRNKNLNITIDFYSPNGGTLESYAPEKEGLEKSFTYGFDNSSELKAGTDSTEVTYTQSVTCTYTTVYSEVILTTSVQSTTSNHQILNYKYHFSHYDDGAMVSPNIHLVTKRMMAVFSVPYYNYNDKYEINIITHAEIFKDAKWPLSNYTLSDDKTHSYKN